MKLLYRAIVGFVLGAIAGIICIQNGLAGIGGFVFLLVWGLVIWFFSDSNLRKMKEDKKIKEERMREEREWKRKAYSQEVGRRKAQEDIEKERQRKDVQRKHPLGYPALSRSIFGKRSRL